jgi:hypothetical protein
VVGVGVAVVAVVVVASAVAAADGLAIGEVVGVCPSKLIASATRQMQRRINFFILVLWS